MFKGYVIIKVVGTNIEKFVNICVHRKIRFIDVQRYNECMILKMAANEFERIREVAKKAHCSVKILDKRGFIFFLKRYRKRKSFLFGCVAFVAMFLLLWSYIWDIEVLGCPKEKDILEYLDKKNIRVGSIKYRIDVDKLEYDLITNFRDIGWVDVRVKGTRLVINLSRREKIPDVEDRDLPCDVVAKKDGIVTKLLVKNGVESVKVGDAIVAGDVLISGIILGETSDDVKVVHAKGTVLAKTVYEQREEVECISINKVYTGKVSKEYKVHLLGKELFRLRCGKGTGKYDESSNLKKIRLLRNFVMPLKIEECKREYYTESREVLTMCLARKRALDLARDKILRRIPKSSAIIKQQVDYFEYKGRVFVNIVVETCEDIAKEQLIK